MVYALILVVILGAFISSRQISAVDATLSHKLAYFEAQARQACDAGLEIALRRPTGPPYPIIGTYTRDMNAGPIASWSVTWEIAVQPIGGVDSATVTALVYDRNGRIVARKTVFNTATNSYFQNQWIRP